MTTDELRRHLLEQHGATSHPAMPEEDPLRMTREQLDEYHDREHADGYPLYVPHVHE